MINIELPPECELCGQAFVGVVRPDHCYACHHCTDPNGMTGFSVRDLGKAQGVAVHHCFDCHAKIVEQVVAAGHRVDLEGFEVGFTLSYIEIAYSMAISRIHARWT